MLYEGGIYNVEVRHYCNLPYECSVEHKQSIIF